MARARTKLSRYRAKRDFDKTREPSGATDKRASSPDRSFVVQAHRARAMHYDFRLELDGVLVSWAVPKGPSLDPRVRRLAVQTEDHPLEYADFEGLIPSGEYGAGAVIVWDRGTWSTPDDPKAALAAGRLHFSLQGRKLHGRWNLIRTGGDLGEKSQWLLMKGRDDHARSGAEAAIVAAQPASVISGDTIESLLTDSTTRADPRSAAASSRPSSSRRR